MSEPLLDAYDQQVTTKRSPRVVSLDVFRGLCVFLMILVDYGGSVFPIISHSPWNGVRLADFVMPFFLFIAGISPALVYKKVPDRFVATQRAVLRGLKLFLLGVFLQGGYFHGVTSMTYGVDIERIRWLGILQFSLMCLAILLSAIYTGLLYGLYVPDWKFKVLPAASSLPSNDTSVYMVKCSVRGDLGPACNSAAMIDRYFIGIDHLYAKPVYRNLKVCNMSNGQVPESSPSWCNAPFDPEAAVTCIIGLQYGHILANLQDHKRRLESWTLLSISIFAIGLFLAFVGIPVNKSLYTISYMLITSASAGITFCIMYLLVDVYGFRRLTFLLEWMGIHSLSIFVLVTSNLAVIAVQGFYLHSPKNNMVHWIITCFVNK
ncbi:hypothetical protein G4B88_001486 [Cannabis sativa]|uniref:Heparan-alpha-glucosaminide N-acetyltransferase catalytic domain-containing protein n=1 Tax=Cannabis sativa TaxID=3483 RepID=A0A7J6FMP4_CANSA|nr:hypothetical protein G4B88_001486 [Cannabis sativa]